MNCWYNFPTCWDSSAWWWLEIGNVLGGQLVLPPIIAWASWAYVDHLPGLYPWCIIWGVVYARNWLKWTRQGEKGAILKGTTPQV